MREKLAKVVSLIFGFPLIIFLMFYGHFLSGLNGMQGTIMLSLLVLFEMIIPLAILIILMKNGLISDIDIVNRKERILPFLLITVCFSIAVILCKQFGNEFIFQFQLTLFMTMLASFAITLFWKISLHMGIATITSLFLFIFSGVKTLPFALIIPLMYWARLFLKRHTHAQLIAGFLLNTGLSLILLEYFGYLR